MKFPRLTSLLIVATALLARSVCAQETFAKIPERPVDLAAEKNLYTVGYAHLDTQWRWTYPLVIRDYIRNTMQGNFKLFEKYPNYLFNFTGSRRYEFMKEYYPADYERVKKYVAEGRWFPAGSSVDENDAIVPSLESYQRQFLYGNRFFDREFGVHSEEFMLPDCFGFPASLPTILHHGGIKGFSTQKLTWGSPIGIPFNVGVWEGPDGSQIVAALNPLSYTGRVKDDLSKSETWLNRINATGEKSGVYVDFHYYGVGDRGGAPDDNSVNWIEKSLKSDGPVRVISSRSDQMFKDITPAQAAKLPRYKGEMLLTEHSAGSINSQAYMKRWNRKNELLANAAESAAVGASWLGAFAYPHDAFYRAWDLVLGSQMHDILPGTSLPQAYNLSWNDEVLALNQFAGIAERASGAVLSALDTRARGTPVAVYNPLSIEREDPVEVLLPFDGQPPAAVTAFDPAGQAVPTQILGREGDALRILFVAKAPSFGYAVYDLRTGADASPKTGLRVAADSLENARYRVTLNADGDVASIFDKTAKRELLSAPARLAFQTETPRQFPAWNMDWADRQKPARAFVGGPAAVRVVENGPARVALEISRAAEGSAFIERISLSAGSAGDRVEYRTRIDWRTTASSLKTDYRFTVANPDATYDSQVGVVVRNNNNPQRFESPHHQWMDLTAASGDYGVAVLNDSKFGSDKPDDNSLRLTLLYTPGTRGGYQDQGTQDHGRHDILYALAGHPGNWAAADIPWQAARLNQPLLAFYPGTHSGPLGKVFSLARLNSDQAKVVALKKAEASTEFVVRLKEINGQPATGLKLAFPSAVLAAREIDGQERPIGPATVKDGALTFDLKGFGVRAFALTLAPPPATVPAVVSTPVPLAYDLDVASTDAARTDGAIDAEGRTYPAEMLPSKIDSEGVTFLLGSTADGAKNALVARGQEIALPDGDFNRVHLLVAARKNDFTGQLKLGGRSVALNVPTWTGFIGQWDSRLWDRPIPEASYGGTQKTVGLVPGYIKRTSVAWFATHHHLPADNAYYAFSYLFETDYALPPGSKTLTLPNDENLLVFAVSLARLPGVATPAAPLYDTLADHQQGGVPSIPQAGQTFTDSTAITLAAPLYHVPGDLRYTLDGSEPGAASPAYTEPFFVGKTATIKARQLRVDGSLGPVVSGLVTINDVVPPTVRDAIGGKNNDRLLLDFSEPLDPTTAARPENYTISPARPIRAVELAPGGGLVTLVLGQPVDPDTRYVVETRALTDLAGNKLAQTRIEIRPLGTVYTRLAVVLPDERLTEQVTHLPLKKSDSWTLNFLVKPNVTPDHLTLIAGFGRPTENKAGGTGRYFAFFKDGIRFWAANADVVTNSPLEVGRWQMLTATYDGKTITLYKDAQPIAKQNVNLKDDTDNTVGLGLPDAWNKGHLFAGRIQAFTIRRVALTPEQVKQLAEQTKPF